MVAAPVTVETWFRGRFDLSCRLLRSRGMANQMVSTLDVFAIDAESEIRRGSDFLVAAFLRTIEDGLGVAGATGELSVYKGGVEIGASPYSLAADSGRGVGWMSCVGQGCDIVARGLYRWELLATAPDGGQALTTGIFRLE